MSASVASPDAVPEVKLVKFGMGAMTGSERSDLFEQIDTYAMFESFLISCNSPSAIELRVIKGVEACVKQDALKEVSRYFRAKLAAASKGAANCEDPQTKDLMVKLRKAIDDQVDRVTKLCKECLLCKL